MNMKQILTWLSPKRAWLALLNKPLGCWHGCSRNYVAMRCPQHRHLIAHLIGDRA